MTEIPQEILTAIDTAVVEAIHALRIEQPGRAYDILVKVCTDYLQAAGQAAGAEVERLREALEKIEAHPIRTPIAGRPCAGLPGYPACQDIARTALRREPSTAA